MNPAVHLPEGAEIRSGHLLPAHAGCTPLPVVLLARAVLALTAAAAQ